MIFDAIAALIAAIVEPILFAAVYAIAGIANLFLILVELVVGLFIHGYKTKRFSKKEWKDRSSKISGWSSLIVLLAIIIAVAVMEFLNREIQFVADDGHSLPFAEIVIITEDDVRNERTDKTGKVEIPRFDLTSVSIIDPRYVEKSWTKEEIGKRLVAERTLLGSGLDKIANSLLKKDE